MTTVTPELVAAAYTALLTGDRAKIAEYWSEDLRFHAPGQHKFAGWHEGLDSFRDYLAGVYVASGGSWQTEILHSIIDGDHSVELVKVHAVRAGAKPDSTSPFDVLDFTGAQISRWENGKVVEGTAGYFGDGATNANQWWSPIGPDGERRDL
jgi:hypothetical protein